GAARGCSRRIGFSLDRNRFAAGGAKPAGGMAHLTQRSRGTPRHGQGADKGTVGPLGRDPRRGRRDPPSIAGARARRRRAAQAVLSGDGRGDASRSDAPTHGLSVPPDQTLVVVTRAHERYDRPALRDLPPSLMVVQPDSRGTAPAFLYALLRLA